MFKYFLLAALFMFPFSFVNAQDKEIDIDTFISLMEKDGYELIDIRTEKEISGGIIENSKHVNFLSEDFEDMVSNLSKENIYLLYCRSGNRSKTAATKMGELGFEAYSLKGGIIHWENMGYPLYKLETEEQTKE